MSEFTLDTAGAVPIHGTLGVYTWSDLSPFTQGYVKAMFASLATPPFTDKPHLKIPQSMGEQIVGFSDLAPETLARIMKDCGEHISAQGSDEAIRGFRASAQAGANYWRLRSKGGYSFLPPQTVTLADDGKIYLRDASPVSSAQGVG